jgi:hypothetical protein
LPSRILEMELRCKMLGYKSSKLKFVFLFDLFLNVEYLCAKQNRFRIERPALEDSNRKLNHGFFLLRLKHVDLSFLGVKFLFERICRPSIVICNNICFNWATWTRTFDSTSNYGMDNGMTAKWDKRRPFGEKI